MFRVLATKGAEFAELNLGRRILFVFLRSVVSTLAVATRKKDVDSHELLLVLGK